MVWVKFHEEITRGAKRGLPRAVRFVFLELSLLARPGRGTIELPVGMSDVDAVHDLLGGSRREIAEALRLFTTGDDAPIRFDGEERNGRRLVIPSWARWNNGAEATGASTERSRRFRSAQRSNSADATQPEREGNDDATTVAPASQRSGNDDATAPRVEKSREDQIPPVVPPSGGPPEQGSLLAVDPPSAKGRRTGIPAGWRPRPDEFATGAELGMSVDRVRFEADKFRDRALAEDVRHVRWDSAFANWLRNADRFDRRDGIAPTPPNPANAPPHPTGVLRHLPTPAPFRPRQGPAVAQNGPKAAPTPPSTGSGTPDSFSGPSSASNGQVPREALS